MPNTSFFITIKSLSSGSTSYRGEKSHIAAGAYSSVPNTSFFYTIKSLASGSTSYRGQNSHTAAGAYSSTLNHYPLVRHHIVEKNRILRPVHTVQHQIHYTL